MWGAEGGNGGANGSIVGAKGGYTEGLIYLTEGEKLTFFVGGKGETGKTTGVPIGGYNGGGNGTYISSVVGTGGAGGGATDVRYNYSPTKYRYVRYYLNGSSSGTANHIVEFQVF